MMGPFLMKVFYPMLTLVMLGARSSSLQLSDLGKKYSNDVVLNDSDVAMFPEMVKRMMMENKLSKEAKERLGAVFDPFRSVALENSSRDPVNITQVNRKCGQLISRMTVEDVKKVTAQIFYFALDKDSIGGALARLFLDVTMKYGIETWKICTSCEEFYEEYGGGENAPDHYEYYCGVDTYTYNATLSGIIMLPLNGDGSYLKGSLKGSLWNHWSTLTTFTIPSELFPSEPYWGDNLEEMMSDRWVDIEPVTLGSVSVGSVGLSADYFGYGESWEYYKCPSLKRQYQVGIVPFVLKAKQAVTEITNGEMTMSGTLVNSGYSEGCLAGIAVTGALANVGFKVGYTQVGGCPYDTMTNQGVMYSYKYGGSDNKFVPLWASTFSSTHPDVVNTNQGQDLLNGEWRDEVLSWVRVFDDGLDLDLAGLNNELAQAGGDVMFINHDFDEMVNNASDQGLTYPCDLAEVGKTDILCEALAENDMRYLVEETKQPLSFCAAIDDQWFPNHPCRLKALLNRNLYLLRIPFVDHIVAGAICLSLFYFYFFSPPYTLLN